MVRIAIPRFSQFREKFTTKISQSVTGSWFPGHMFKGIKQMQAKLAVVDCFLEVHDARIPLSGRNPNFHTMLTSIKPHILLLNKCDLIDSSMKKKINEFLPRQNLNDVLFTDCKSTEQNSIGKIIPKVIKIVGDTENFRRMNATSINIMVIGVPNVGKSSLINRLRNIHLNKKKASAVGATPGITKSVLEKIKILDDPLVYLFDTPGVVQPQIDNIETGLKLALCRTLRDDLVGEELMADYLLFWLNQHKNKRYIEYLKLKEAVDDIRLVLLHIARQQNFLIKIRNSEGSIRQSPDMLRSCNYFLKGFRDGHFGKLVLDIDHFNKVH